MIPIRSQPDISVEALTGEPGPLHSGLALRTSERYAAQRRFEGTRRENGCVKAA